MSLLQTTVFDGAGGIIFLLARLLFGLVLAFMGLNHFMDTEMMTGYADSKGVPAPKMSIPPENRTLIFGGLGIALGIFPVIAAGAIATYFIVITPKMHDFWNAEDTQSEMTQFLKNVALLGGSLAFLAVGGVDWPLAMNIRLF